VIEVAGHDGGEEREIEVGAPQKAVPGTLHVWAADGELLAQIHDSGYISDQLAGRRRPALDGAGGNGLWVVYQLCDLVELRTASTGVTIRLHFRLGPRA